MRIPTQLDSVVIRAWHYDDRHQLVQIANNRRIWRNLTDLFPHPYTEADAETWFQIVASSERDWHLAIEVSGDVAGGIGAVARDGVHRGTAEFGYWLGERFWGHGIATAAARAFADYLCETERFVRLESHVFEWNPASMRVLEHAGFQREGLLRQSITKDGQVIDSVIYARILPLTSRTGPTGFA